jgi:hypothetical protein
LPIRSGDRPGGQSSIALLAPGLQFVHLLKADWPSVIVQDLLVRIVVSFGLGLPLHLKRICGISGPTE